MDDRMQEMKGNVKKGVGKVTGDEELEAEGEVEHDSARAARKAKGLGNQVKGHAEEGLGKVTGDEELRTRGLADRVKGDAERTG
jgi:uncharacterized protein YjbJ (UPF0337 family)